MNSPIKSLENYVKIRDALRTAKMLILVELNGTDCTDDKYQELMEDLDLTCVCIKGLSTMKGTWYSSSLYAKDALLLAQKGYNRAAWILLYTIYKKENDYDYE